MTIAEYLGYLSGLGIELRYEDERLICNAPKGVLTPELSAAIKLRKAELIGFLREAAEMTAEPDRPIGRADRDRPLPLSASQRSLWFIDQLIPGLHGYNLPSVFWLKGRLDLGAFERSVDEILRRHEILRTSFRLEGDEPVQVIAPPQAVRFAVIDLSDRPSPTDEETFLPLLREEVKIPFDLSKGPLVRIRLLRLTPTEHIFFWMTHHTVWDGWSFDIMLDELAALYDAFTKGLPSPLPELPIQYADYAAWQRQRHESGELDRELAYWREQLGGELPLLQMPSDRPRPAQMSYRGGRLEGDITPAITQSLRELGAQEGATLFMVLLAAFETLLYRFSGQEDIIVGCPMWGRIRPETEKMIGFFVNTVVLRVKIEGTLPFRELLRRVRSMCIDAQSHQCTPFERLVEALNPARDLSRTPIYQALFSYQDARTRPLQIGKIAVEQIPAPAIEAATADILLWFKETKSELMGRFDFNADIFDESTIERLMRCFQTLIGSIIENPDATVARLPLLTDQERRRLLVEWNATSYSFPSDIGVHELFGRQAQRTPDNVAVECDGDCLTYAELERRSNQLAQYLKECGSSPGARVGICLERSAEMAAGLLGILKTGAAYVPLDPDYPPDRLSFILADSGMHLLLTEESVKPRLPESTVRTVSIDGEAPSIERQPATRPGLPDFSAELPAYVIYTSGSTGRPKGVRIPHRAVVNFLASMAREPGMGPEDVVLAVTTISFDIAGLELFLPLTVGARSVIVSRETAMNGTELAAAIDRAGATMLQATPGTWRLLLAAGWQGSRSLKILCGGEPFPPDLGAELLARGKSVWNMYGPTETTIWSTLYRITDASKPLLIGRPIANTTAYIVDPLLQPVPIGVRGELCLGGAGVALDYMNRPDLTEKSFIADPFSPVEGARIYKTGDLARYHADGAIECCGRSDTQVKIRGFRIELGEIEAVLCGHEAVAQGVAAKVEPKAGDTRLAAYIVPKPGASFTVTELRNHLRSRLPDYMVPQHFVELDALPLTPSGKVDRKHLPLPFDAPDESQDRYVAPRTASERYLVSLWQELLQRERVGIHDNFFEIGGHSLLSMTIVARVEKDTGVRLGPRLFLLNTLEQIAVHVAPPSAPTPAAAMDQPAKPRIGGGEKRRSLVQKIRDTLKS